MSGILQKCKTDDNTVTYTNTIKCSVFDTSQMYEPPVWCISTRVSILIQFYFTCCKQLLWTFDTVCVLGICWGVCLITSGGRMPSPLRWALNEQTFYQTLTPLVRIQQVLTVQTSAFHISYQLAVNRYHNKLSTWPTENYIHIDRKFAMNNSVWVHKKTSTESQKLSVRVLF